MPSARSFATGRAGAVRKVALAVAAALLASGPVASVRAAGPARLVIGVVGAAPTDDPLVERDVRNLQFPPLVGLAADTLDPVPVVAESWSRAGDGWTYTIRAGRTWSDGTPVTTADVVHSLEQQRDAFPAVTARAEDDRRVTVVGIDDPVFLLNVMPAHAAGHDDKVSGGDWQLADEAGDQLVLRVVERPGRPALDEIVFRSYPDADMLLDALADGDVDVAARIPPARYDDLRAIGGATALHANDGDQWLMRVRIDDPSVRHAIARSIDRDALVAAVAHGVGRSSPVPIVARGQRWRLDHDEERALAEQLEPGSTTSIDTRITIAAPPDETVTAIATFVEDALTEAGARVTRADDTSGADVVITLRDPTDDPRPALAAYTCAEGVWCDPRYEAAFAALAAGDEAARTEAVHGMVSLLAEEGVEVTLFEPDILQGLRTDNVTGLLREPRTERLVVLWPSVQQYGEAVPTSTLGGEHIPDSVFAAIASGVGAAALGLLAAIRLRASGRPRRARRWSP